MMLFGLGDGIRKGFLSQQGGFESYIIVIIPEAQQDNALAFTWADNYNQPNYVATTTGFSCQ